MTICAELSLARRRRRRYVDSRTRSNESVHILECGDELEATRLQTGATTETARDAIRVRRGEYHIAEGLRRSSEIKNDPRWTRGTELEIQNRALFNELEKQKLERLNVLQE